MSNAFVDKSAYDSDSASRLRIQDILLLDERQEDRLYLMANSHRRGTADRSSAGIGCTRFFGLLLPSLRRPKGKITGITEERGEVNLQSSGVRQSPSSSEHLTSATSDAEKCSSSDAHVNVGFGYCLLYLLAACKNELDKMVELRKQMVILLHNSQSGQQQKEVIQRTPETNDIYAYSTAEMVNVLATPSSVSCGKPLEVCFPGSKDCVAGMGQLELELQAELERLQLHLDPDKLEGNSSLEMTEVTITGSTTSSISHDLSSGIVIDLEDDTCEVHNGVCPLELERRLHELLEARQNEQIRELEAALERAERKLHQQELEMSWWKDTVCLISKHVAEPSLHTFGHISDQEN